MIDMDEIEKFELDEANMDASAGPRFSTTMEYDGLVCPDRYVMDFTPLEFEEVSYLRCMTPVSHIQKVTVKYLWWLQIAGTFRENDTDKSGTIDTSELMTMLHNMEMEYSEANIQVSLQIGLVYSTF